MEKGNFEVILKYFPIWATEIHCQFIANISKFMLVAKNVRFPPSRFLGFRVLSTTSQVKTLLNLLKSYPLILSSKSFLRKHSESFETWRFWTSASTTLLLFLEVSIFLDIIENVGDDGIFKKKHVQKFSKWQSTNILHL